ncbi:MAG: ferritin [Bacteroidetes bacterium]|nr:ferritin [Bacteroidota bacterium]
MINKKVEKALIDQIENEEVASRFYMVAASWCEVRGYPGAAKFLYKHSDEERMHMIKLIRYVNDKGGHATLKKLDMPDVKYDSLLNIFEKIFTHEQAVTKSINKLFENAFNDKDYTTSQFLHWYIEEQIEEERMFKGILDKFRLAGNQAGGLFLLDKELDSMAAVPK